MTFLDADFSTLIKAGGSLVDFAGSVVSQSAKKSGFDANAAIAGMNAEQIAAFLPLQREALDSDIASIREAARLRESEITNNLARANRQAELTFASLNSEVAFANLNREEILIQRDITDKVLEGTIQTLENKASEDIRKLEVLRDQRVSDIRARTGFGGVKVEGSVDDVSSFVQQQAAAEAKFTKEQRDLAISTARLQGDIDKSQFRLKIGGVDAELLMLDLEIRQAKGALDDAIFDAALESEINKRNADVEIARKESDKKLLAVQAGAQIANELAQKGAFEDASSGSYLATAFAGAKLGLDVLTMFPTLGPKIIGALGIEVGGTISAGGGAASLAGAAGFDALSGLTLGESFAATEAGGVAGSAAGSGFLAAAAPIAAVALPLAVAGYTLLNKKPSISYDQGIRRDAPIYRDLLNRYMAGDPKAIDEIENGGQAWLVQQAWALGAIPAPPASIQKKIGDLANTQSENDRAAEEARWNLYRRGLADPGFGR